MNYNRINIGVKAALAADLIERAVGRAAYTFGQSRPPTVEVVELAGIEREAALKIPMKEAQRECAAALTAQLDENLHAAIERFLGEPLTDPETQVGGRLAVTSGVDASGEPTDAEDWRGDLFAMDDVPILWAGPVKVEPYGDPGDEHVRATRQLRHLRGESAPMNAPTSPRWPFRSIPQLAGQRATAITQEEFERAQPTLVKKNFSGTGPMDGVGEDEYVTAGGVRLVHEWAMGGQGFYRVE